MDAQMFDAVEWGGVHSAGNVRRSFILSRISGICSGEAVSFLLAAGVLLDSTTVRTVSQDLGQFMKPSAFSPLAFHHRHGAFIST